MPTLQFEFPPTKDRYDNGFVCNICGSYVKRYTRKFNSNMAIAMIALLKHSNGKYVSLEKFLADHGYQRCGDASYLIHYGFLERKVGQREDGSPKNGMYRLTGRGVMFCEGKIKAAEKFKILHNHFEGFSGKDITIQDALGTKFNYQELMDAK